MLAQVPMMDDRKTGYKFLQKTKEGLLHAGEDLNSGKTGNSDLGKDIKPMSDGEVVFVKNAGIGWGNIMVIYHPEISRIIGEEIFTRCAHFSKVFVQVGQKVTMSDVVALCGKSGTGSPHCHWEVVRGKLDRWTRYTRHDNGKAWSAKEVQDRFYSPYEFVKRVNNIVATLIPEYARSDWQGAMQTKDFPFKDPFQELDINQLQEVFKFYGLLNDVGKMPAYRANFAALKLTRQIKV